MPPENQTGHRSADAHGHPAGTLDLLEIIIGVFGQQFDIDRQVGRRELDGFSRQVTEIFAHRPLDVHRGERKAFVGPLGGHTKGVERPLSDCLTDPARQFLEVRSVKIERYGASERKIGDAED